MIVVACCAVVIGDQFARNPRPLHYEEFLFNATNEFYLVSLYSRSASCAADTEKGVARCDDSASDNRVRFSRGCIEVSGEGACIRMNLRDRYLGEPGIVFQVSCGDETKYAGDSFLLFAPAGATCRKKSDGIVECFLNGAADDIPLLVSASCDTGCGESSDPDADCLICYGGDCS